MPNLVDAEFRTQQRVDAPLPVVEVTGDDDRRLLRNLLLHEVDQETRLSYAAAFDQAEVDTDQVHVVALARGGRATACSNPRFSSMWSEMS